MTSQSSLDVELNGFTRPDPNQCDLEAEGKKDSANESSTTGGKCLTPNPKFTAYKNLFGISISFFLIFGAYRAEVSLQSSVNNNDGLGLVSLSLLYGTFFFSCLYSAAFINFFGAKYTILIGYCGMTVYTVSNFYQSWYTLVPGSVILGAVIGPMWASHSFHIAHTARQYAHTTGKDPIKLVFFFIGIYVFFFKFSNAPSNILSSVVLLNGHTSIVDTSLGDTCNNTDAADLDVVYYYVLLSIYFVLDILAIIILLVFVDNIAKVDREQMSLSKMVMKYVVKPSYNTLKLLISWKMNVIVIMMILDGYTVSFMTGLFTKVYISDCIGIHWIGFCQAVYGTTSATSALVNGYLVRLVPQYVLVYIGMAANIGITVFLLVWDLQPTYFVILIAFIFGYCEGLWNSVPPSLVGTIVPHKNKQATHGYYRMGLALGFTMGYLSTILFEAFIVLLLDLALIVIALIAYSVLMLLTQPALLEVFPYCKKEQKEEDCTMN